MLAFHLLTGQLPFKGNSPMEMMEQHVHSAPPIPAEVNPTIPPAMSGLILALLEKDPSKRPDADRAKRDLKAAGRQLQQDSPDGSTPREGHPALTTSSAADLDPRLKELARKADTARLVSTLARNWPWVLAGLGLLWIAGVVIWMMVTPTVPPSVPTALPQPKKLPPAPIAPVKAEAPPAPRPPPAVAAPEPAPAKADEPVEVKPFAEPEPEAVAAPIEKAVRPEKHDAPKSALKEEVALNKWRLNLKNEIAMLDARLTGKLEQFRPALNILAGDIEHVSNAQGQQSAEGRLRNIKAQIDKEADNE